MTQSRTKPPARPQQERARETRERILESAAHLFAECGLANTSTNHIAHQAQISIGSLYRYFADKHEIVAELRRQTAAELEHQFTAIVLAGTALQPKDAIGASLRGIVAALAKRRGLLKALAADATLDGLGFNDMNARLQLLTKAYLLHVLGPQPEEILEARAYLMVTVGLATTLRIGLHPPSGLDQDRLVEEVASMISGWLVELQE